MVMFQPSHHLVAGHEDGLVAHGLFAKHAYDQEAQFYNCLRSHDSSKLLIYLGDLLSHWTPVYYGGLSENQLSLPINDIDHLDKVQFASDAKVEGVVPTDKKYILMNNLYEDYTNPSILDIKLGKLLTDEYASEEKRARLEKVSQSTTSSSLYFRICGMKLFHSSSILPEWTGFQDMGDCVELVEQESGKYLKFNKYFGRNLTPSNMKLALTLYFDNSIQDPVIRHHYKSQFWKRLQLLYNCLLDYEIRIISGSLLFLIENNPTILMSAKNLGLDQVDPLVFENDTYMDSEPDSELDSDNEEKIVNKTIKKLSSLHIIDFAHAKFVTGKGPDNNILQGIENLIEIFESLVNDNAETK